MDEMQNVTFEYETVEDKKENRNKRYALYQKKMQMMVDDKEQTKEDKSSPRQETRIFPSEKREDL